MEKDKMLKMMVPALAAAVILGLVLFFVLGPKDNDTIATEKGQDGKTRVVTVPETQQASDRSTNTMSQTCPPQDLPEYTTLGKDMKRMDVLEGKGDPCPEGATITVHYAGWLATDGTRFDSSYLNNRPPLVSPLSGLITGWQIGIPGMKPGGIRRLIIPPDLAYRDKNMGSIPPNSTLVFEFKLLEWKK